jgi:hypothetical protein
MSQTVQININTGNEAVATLQSLLLKTTGNQRAQALNLAQYFMSAASGERTCNFDVQVNYGSAVAATGTIAFSGVSTAADTILINGVTFTCVSSGATNNQWNVKGTAALQAAEVVRAINASTTALVSGTVIASVSGTSTVKLTAAQAVGGVVTALPGQLGNAITIAKGTDAGSVMTVSGARLTGGTAVTANVYHFGL